MSGNLHGADVEALRQLAHRIAQGGETLNGVVGVVESAMPVSEQWSGMDAESFRDEWYGSHGPSITATAQALAEVADTVRGNADGQEATSDDLSGGGIGVDGGRGIGVDMGQGVRGGTGQGVRGSTGSGIGGGEESPDEFYADPPASFRDLIDDLGFESTYTGLAAYAVEILDLGPLSAAASDAGKVSSAFGVLTGGYQAVDSMFDFILSGESGDLYSAGDGWTTAVLSAGSFVPVVGPGFALASAVWGGASLINGLVSDRPLTQNLTDYTAGGLIYNEITGSQLSEDLADTAHDVLEPAFWKSIEVTSDAMDAVGSAADAVGDVANDVVDGGRDLLEGAGDLLGF